MTQIPDTIIKTSFNISVWTIEKFHNMKVYEDKLQELRDLREGTLGKDIADCLDKGICD
jgi:hypothetical protein